MQCFYISLDPYLAQWFSFICGGGYPLTLRKGSPESILIQRFSRKKSEAESAGLPAPGDLAIRIPESKAKPADIYCHVPDSAKDLFLRSIRQQFDLMLFNDIVRDLFPASLKRDLIYAWMEKYQIDNTEQNWLAVEKRYSRLRARLLQQRGYRVKKSH